MVELALVLPLFLMVIFGIVVLGLGVFYQQQLTNAAREAARYAIVHSATAQCPTVSWQNPAAPPLSYYRCDAPSSAAGQGWPNMTAAGRNAVFGLDRSQVQVSACWSGYRTKNSSGAYAGFDAPPTGATGTPNDFVGCTIGGVDPRTNPSAVTPASSCAIPATTSADDQASDLAASNGSSANQITVFTCYLWTPPLSGFLLIPTSIPLRAVITEEVQYQQ